MSSKIITPGPSEILAAKALADARLGLRDYQWEWPPANSRYVRADAPGPVAPSTFIGTSVTVAQYEVPTGERFVLTGVVFEYINGNSWVEGAGGLLWSLVVSAAGDRTVEWFTNVSTQLGSRQDGPYPVKGRLEFDPRDILSIQALSTVSTINNGLLVGHIVGFTYPNSESV